MMLVGVTQELADRAVVSLRRHLGDVEVGQLISCSLDRDEDNDLCVVVLASSGVHRVYPSHVIRLRRLDDPLGEGWNVTAGGHLQHTFFYDGEVVTEYDGHVPVSQLDQALAALAEHGTLPTRKEHP